jgi:SAM-dependent methyltransferase
MFTLQRALTVMQSALKAYGPAGVKKLLWDKEYSEGKWNFAACTVGDCVYPHLEKYLEKGNILDLGCGAGNTATELAQGAYQTYVGVDISEACLRKARRRTLESGRAGKNHFLRADFLRYRPSQTFDVILFRESMYHIPLRSIKTTLDWYSHYLTDRGVFIVRIQSTGPDGKVKSRPTAMIDTIETAFDVAEKCQYAEFGTTIIVFRPRREPRTELNPSSSARAAR